MANPVIRVDITTHEAVKAYAKAQGDEVRIVEVIDKIITAGIAALSGGEATATEAPVAKASSDDEDRETLLSRALRGVKIKGPSGEVGAVGAIDAEAALWNEGREAADRFGRVDVVTIGLGNALRRWEQERNFAAKKAKAK